jgi:pyrroline-5-carboxylate reductase
VEEFKEFGLMAVDASTLISTCATIILAIKPDQLETVCAPLSFRPDQLVISVLAGCTFSKLGAVLHPARMVQVMPNVAARIAASMTLVRFGSAMFFGLASHFSLV